MQRIVFASAVAATAFALDISAEERTTLNADLEAWRAKFGENAAAEGLLPNNLYESASSDDLLLTRLKAAKDRLPQLKAANPDAEFSILTPYALLSNEEFRERLGRSFSKGQPERNLRVQDVNYEALGADSAATSIDWTTSKCVNAVKDQGNCGSCWTFSATGAAESAHCIATGTLLNLSEQQLVSCDTVGGQQGCDGGYEDKALNWIATNGQCLTKDYPYTSGSSGVTGTCKKTCKAQKLSIGSAVEIVGESALTNALNTQPVTVAVEAGNDVWQYYTSGIVSSCPGAQSDHAVIAVGYGTSGSKNFYKIRNSWGSSWGESGYIRLQRGVGGKGMCNVAEQPAYPKINK